MYTRCTACHTVHPVNAGLLARSGGRYRCGKCNKVSNALDSLFDEWPGAGDRPPESGATPVLGLSIDLDQAREAMLTPGEDPLPVGAVEPGAKRRISLVRPAWIAMSLIVASLIIYQLSVFYQAPLQELPLVQSAMLRLGLQSPPAQKPFRDLEQIHLVSRELTSHPFRADMLRLTATLVNRAPLAQPFPILEVILLDANGQPMSQQRFKPSDYLAEGASAKSGMTPQAYLPVLLDLPDPGQVAVGFELNFL